jgi:hypothetical protein
VKAVQVLILIVMIQKLILNKSHLLNNKELEVLLPKEAKQVLNLAPNQAPNQALSQALKNNLRMEGSPQAVVNKCLNHLQVVEVKNNNLNLIT